MKTKCVYIICERVNMAIIISYILIVVLSLPSCNMYWYELYDVYTAVLLFGMAVILFN